MSEKEIRQRLQDGDPLEFSHTAELQIGGQIEAGFVITGLYGDRDPEEENDLLSRFMSTYIATRATK